MCPSPDHRDDEELARAAGQGDSDALELLLRRSYERIYTLCRRMCPDLSQAQDATQEALIAIVKGLAGYDGRAKFSTWSYRVASNACIDEIRRSKRRSERFLRLAAPGGRGPLCGDELDLAGPQLDDPADLVLGHDVQRELSLALAELDEKFRIPVVLRDVSDLEYSEIAEILGIPPGTVRSRIARGRARLLELLSEGESGQDGNSRARRIVRTEEP